MNFKPWYMLPILGGVALLYVVMRKPAQPVYMPAAVPATGSNSNKMSGTDIAALINASTSSFATIAGGVFNMGNQTGAW